MLTVSPFLWFNDDAEAAARHYVSVFSNSRLLERSPMAVSFELAGQRVTALNGGPHFQLTEAFSFLVSCDSQSEVDHYWDALLTDGGTPSQCGWLKDRFGLSWQVIPTRLIELLGDPDPERAGRVMQAMLQMGKIEVATLEAARVGT